MPFYPTEHDWTLTARPYRIPLDECFLGRYAVNSLPTSGPRWSGKDACPPQKTNGTNATQRTKENPNHIPLNCAREEGKLFGVDDQQDTEHNGHLYMWTDKDKEQYQQSNILGC